MRCVLTIIFLLFFSIYAHAKTLGDATCKPRVPKIEYAEAIQIALKSVGSDAEAKTVFIDGANLRCEKNKHYWIVTLRKREIETGQTIIKVYMDGTSDTSLMKDG